MPDLVNRPALLDAVAPEEWPDEIPVLVVGGGPVGLTTALLLAQRGIELLLVERRSFQTRFPRAHLLNVRTMEILHEAGVADDVYEMAPENDRWRKVVWYTSIDGPTARHGLKIGEVPAWGGGTDAQRYAEASPRRFTNLPQIRLDPLLARHAAAACPGRIRAQQELVALEQDAEGVLATIADRETGTERTIRARYLVAADGGRASAGLLGVRYDGPRAIQDVQSYHVTTDLSAWSEPDALLAHLIQPHGQGRPVGVLQALGPGVYGRDSPEWLVALNRAPGTDPPTDEEQVCADVRAMLGLPPAHPVELHTVSHWQFEGVVAQHFRVGSAFLAGDAAHRHPPTGGLGLNSGVQDAHNLAWKLAAVLKGQAADSLLDSYEAERRPVTASNTAHSLENAGRHTPIGTAIGLAPGLTEEEGWERIGVLLDEGPEAEQRRAEVALAVADNANDYSQLNVEAGFRYPVGALVADETPAPDDMGSPIDFRPTTRPGHHLPHVWVPDCGGEDHPVSTIDLVAAEGLTLFVGAAAAVRWREAVHRAAGSAGSPVSVVVIPDDTAEWIRVREVGDSGAVLVRPDRVVAWRTTTMPADPAEVLGSVVHRVLRGRYASPDEDPAQPYLDRIHAAAVRLGR